MKTIGEITAFLILATPFFGLVALSYWLGYRDGKRKQIPPATRPGE